MLEFAPLRLPEAKTVAKALCFQLKQFIIKLGTVILAFFIASWLLSSFDFAFRFVPVEESMLAHLCGGLKWLFAPVGMEDWRIAYAALSGLVAKENVAASLELFFPVFPYGARSAFALAVFVLASSPCVSAVAAAAREVGAKLALLYAVAETAGRAASLLSRLFSDGPRRFGDPAAHRRPYPHLCLWEDLPCGNTP